MGLLDGRVAVVTGAGNGIGRSEALTLGRHGAAVVVNDLGSAADSVAAEIVAAGGRASANHGDVSSWKTAADLVRHAVDEYGDLDIVVANAGVCRRNPIADTNEDDFDLQVAVLFKGTYGLLREAGAHWRDRHTAGVDRPRSLIVTSSSAGVPGGVRDFSVYGAMKAGLAAATLSAALEFRPYGVAANAILPHAATRMDADAKGLATVAQFRPDDPEEMNPQHVANVVAYLASPSATWLTGQVYEITGTTVRRWLPWSPAAEVDSPTQWTPEGLNDALATTMYGTMPGGRTIPRT